MTTSAESSLVDPNPAAQSPSLAALEHAPPQLKPVKTRLESLDIFRGLTIMGMLLVNYKSADSYVPLEHADWHGWTPTDLIFPFFLFIVGVATPFSLASRSARSDMTTGRMLGHIWLRALSLFMLGELLQGIVYWPTIALPAGFHVLAILRFLAEVFICVSVIALLIPWRWQRVSMIVPLAITVIFYLLLISIGFANRHAINQGLAPDFAFGTGIFRPPFYRIPGVLQRIGICYGVAASLALFFEWRMILTTAIVLMAIYSALMLKLPMNDHVTGSLTKEDNVARRIDVAVFDRYTIGADGKPDYRQHHTYGEYPDPEGLLSTIPAIATPLLGILAGLWLRTNRSNVEKCAGLLAMGVIVTILGQGLDSWLMPINKKIWTPSFVVFCAGMAMLGLGAIFWFVDVLGRRAWAIPFKVYGMNAIAAYVVAGILVRVGINVHVHRAGKTLTLQGFVAEKGQHAVIAASEWMHSIHLFRFDQPANLALVYPIELILVVLVLMWAMYGLKIFVKV